MEEFCIYLSDLTDEAQERLIEFLGNNGNYDVIPIVVLERRDDDEW